MLTNWFKLGPHFAMRSSTPLQIFQSPVSQKQIAPKYYDSYSRTYGQPLSLSARQEGGIKQIYSTAVTELSLLDEQLTHKSFSEASAELLFGLFVGNDTNHHIAPYIMRILIMISLNTTASLLL